MLMPVCTVAGGLLVIAAVIFYTVIFPVFGSSFHKNAYHYHSAPRVFWIIDNGSSHRRQRCVARLTPPSSRIVSSASKSITKRLRDRFSGGSLAATSTNSFRNSMLQTAYWPRQHDEIRHRISGLEYLVPNPYDDLLFREYSIPVIFYFGN